MGKRQSGNAMVRKVIMKIAIGLYNILENIPEVT